MPVGHDAELSHRRVCRSGRAAASIIHYEFPVDGEYAMKIYTVKKGNMGGSGAFGGIRGEKLEVSLDGERIGLFDWDRGVQSSAATGEPGTIDSSSPPGPGGTPSG